MKSILKNDIGISFNYSYINVIKILDLITATIYHTIISQFHTNLRYQT